MSLKHINELNAEEAHKKFLQCCGCEKWAAMMAQSRPFHNAEHLRQRADECFAPMQRDHWLEAFSAHPKIGDIESLKKKFGATKDWAQGEQSGVKGSPIEVIEGLAHGNNSYEEKFGYIFIVCATGKSASEMLAILSDRLPNDPDNELLAAAEEQKKITHIRLEKLLNEQ